MGEWRRIDVNDETPGNDGIPAAALAGEARRRILVIANETAGGAALCRTIAARAEGGDADVLVVCPALNSRLRHWVSDVGKAQASARERLERSLEALALHGIRVRGQVGDADPIQAIDDALRLYHADEVIISTHPRGRSNWLERRVVEQALERFPMLPITHVVVDLERERAAAAATGEPLASGRRRE